MVVGSETWLVDATQTPNVKCHLQTMQVLEYVVMKILQIVLHRHTQYMSHVTASCPLDKLHVNGCFQVEGCDWRYKIG